MSKRFQAWRQKRKRDLYTAAGGRCQYCGVDMLLDRPEGFKKGDAVPPNKFTVDHVVPRGLGGSNTKANVVAACHDCNGRKAEYENAVAGQWARVGRLTPIAWPPRLGRGEDAA